MCEEMEQGSRGAGESMAMSRRLSRRSTRGEVGLGDNEKQRGIMEVRRVERDMQWQLADGITGDGTKSEAQYEIRELVEAGSGVSPRIRDC